jgi:hypothetical protein
MKGHWRTMRYLVTAVLGLALIAGVANAAEKEWGTRPQPYKATFDVTEHFVKNETDGELVVYENSYDSKNRPAIMKITDENEIIFQGLHLGTRFARFSNIDMTFRSNQMTHMKTYHASVLLNSAFGDIRLTDSSLFKEILSSKKFGMIVSGKEYLFDMSYPAVDQARDFFNQ